MKINVSISFVYIHESEPIVGYVRYLASYSTGRWRIIINVKFHGGRQDVIYTFSPSEPFLVLFAFPGLQFLSQSYFIKIQHIQQLQEYQDTNLSNALLYVQEQQYNKYLSCTIKKL